MVAKYLRSCAACVLMMGLSLDTYASSTTDHLDTIVAVVNSQVISQSELDKEMLGLNQQMTGNGEKTLPPATLRSLALENLIAKDLQLQAAKMVGLSISDDKLNQSLQTIAQQHGIATTELPEALKHQGTTFEDFKKQITAQLLVQQLQQHQLANSLKIDPKQVDALAKKIAANPAQYQKKSTPGFSYHIIDVLIPLAANATEGQLASAKKVFDAISIQITAGKSLPDAVTTANMQSSVVVTDMGWHTKDQLPEGFKHIIEPLKPGQIAPPVRAPNGIHIVELLDMKPVEAPVINSTTITETDVRHILIKADSFTPDSTVERRLLNIRNDITHGTSFAEEAEMNSQDPGSVAQGGNLGWVKPGTLDPKFEQAMNLLTINEVSQPIKTPFGWHLIQVLARRQVSDPQLAYQQQAQEILFNQKMNKAIKDFINELKSQAYIKIY